MIHAAALAIGNALSLLSDEPQNCPLGRGVSYTDRHYTSKSESLHYARTSRM